MPIGLLLFVDGVGQPGVVLLAGSTDMACQQG
jgi:hypothetical protein